MDDQHDSDPAQAALAAHYLVASIPEEDWCHGPLDDLACRYARLQALKDLTADLLDAIADTLVSDMPADTVDTPHGRLQRNYVMSSTWSDDGASQRLRDDLARAVATAMSINVATGEIDFATRNIVTAAMHAAYDAIPSFSTLKVAGRKRFGLHIGDYRSFTETPRVTLTTIGEPG